MLVIVAARARTNTSSIFQASSDAASLVWRHEVPGPLVQPSCPPWRLDALLRMLLPQGLSDLDAAFLGRSWCQVYKQSCSHVPAQTVQTFETPPPEAAPAQVLQKEVWRRRGGWCQSRCQVVVTGCSELVRRWGVLHAHWEMDILFLCSLMPRWHPKVQIQTMCAV